MSGKPKLGAISQLARRNDGSTAKAKNEKNTNSPIAQ